MSCRIFWIQDPLETKNEPGQELDAVVEPEHGRLRQRAGGHRTSNGHDPVELDVADLRQRKKIGELTTSKVEKILDQRKPL